MELDNYLMDLSTMMEVDSEDEGGRGGRIKGRLGLSRDAGEAPARDLST